MKRINFGNGVFVNPKSLDWKAGRRNESSGNYRGKRFYTALDMAIIKKDEASRNGQIKRGEVKRFGNEYICVCGCGSEGCFIHSGFDSVPKEQMNEWEKQQAKDRNRKTIERLGFDYKTSFRRRKNVEN